MRSLTPELDRVILDTHQAAAYPEAARELRALKSLFRKSAHLAELIESCIRNQNQVCGSEVSFLRAFKGCQRDLAASREQSKKGGA